MGALAQAHEGRVAKILRREGELKGREEKRCGGAVLAARHAELARNRGRIVELKAIASGCRKRVEAALARADAYGEGHHSHSHAQHHAPAHGHGHFAVAHRG